MKRGKLTQTMQFFVRRSGGVSPACTGQKGGTNGGHEWRGGRQDAIMETLLSTNDPVRLSFAVSLLEAAGIGHLVADQHMSVLEGSIGVFPRRLMVLADDVAAARLALQPLFEADAG